MPANPTINPTIVKNGYAKQIVTVGAFFFIFGFITWVNGTLIWPGPPVKFWKRPV
jgi:hypothetical protein